VFDTFRLQQEGIVMPHEFPCDLDTFRQIADGRRRVLFTNTPHDYAVGDLLSVSVTGPNTRRLRAVITDILCDPAGRWLQPGVVALSLGNIFCFTAPYTTRVINLRDYTAVAAA